jgi:DNA-directed RNA polymerase specialized sigma24 family protein
MRAHKDVAAEAFLALRCSEDDLLAWREVIETYQHFLLQCVFCRTADWELADEIVDRLWFSMFTGRGAGLAGFHPGQQRLSTFLARQAQHQLSNWVRQQLRQHAKEPLMARPLAISGPDLSAPLILDELAKTLTHEEQHTLLAFLSIDPTSASAFEALSPSAERILRRVAVKLRRLLQS